MLWPKAKMELVKKYKGYLALITSILAMAAGLFVKIDAYAQGKVNEGVTKLKDQTNLKLEEVHGHLEILKSNQESQGKQLDKIDAKQDRLMEILLEKK